MKKSILIAFTVISVMLSVTGCKKGDTGPTGPAGAAGAAGNANVQIFTFSVTANQWVADTVNKQWSSDYTLPSTAIVTGAVLLYAQDGSNWAALPHVDYGVTFEFGYDPTTKIIEVQAADATAATMTPNPGPMTFRVVTIPQAMSKSKLNINWKDYSAVQRVFNLPD